MGNLSRQQRKIGHRNTMVLTRKPSKEYIIGTGQQMINLSYRNQLSIHREKMFVSKTQSRILWLDYKSQAFSLASTMKCGFFVQNVCKQSDFF